MPDLRGFRETVREHRRAVGRTQQQLARSVGLHPDVLSHKLNGRDRATLTSPDVIGIATTLASWGALVSRADVYELLDLMEVPRQAIPATAWSAPPLAGLRADREGVVGGPTAAGRPSRARAATTPDGPVRPAPAPARDKPPGRHRVTPAPLPAPPTQLIGRDRERAEVAAAAAASRLVTLTGAGGTGKTRLALQVARDLTGDFADGVAFIDLAPVRDPAVLATAVARALGLAPTSAEAAEDHLAEALGDRELLLVVDNLEHLLDETQLLSRMLAAAPALRLLATSRIPLRLYGEHTVRVPPLHLPGQGGTGTDAADSEAVQLFIVRARAVRSGFAPDADELAAVGDICAALDGLPLAIELAAARTRLYPPRALLPLLRSRLEVLTGGPRDLPRRQQTLRAALDWSHALLPPGTRRLFARLGVFAGPFDAEAAAAVSAEPDQVRALEHLADVADQSLLEVTADETPGFRMLQTVREYALARLRQALKLFRAAGEPDGVSVILSSLGEVARDAGRPVRARRLFGAALRRHAAAGNKRHMAYELEGFAAAAGLEHAGRQALVYLGAAQVLREEAGGPLPPVEQAILDRILAPALAALSARERQEALNQGRNQPIPATIAHALAEVPRLPEGPDRLPGQMSPGG